MGIGVSSWTLARAVACAGQLGVVSGTAVDTVMVRRLQDGDPGGHVRRAIDAFPIPSVGEQVLRRYFLPGGRAPDAPYRNLPMFKQSVSAARLQLTILANFVEVWLAKEGHDGVVGINLLTKVQMPTLPSLYGAMLAGVDYVLMGAGIPREIPGVLDALAEHRPARLRLEVDGDASGRVEELAFDPREHWAPAGALPRPQFLPIISAHSLAATLARKATGRVDGFVVEGPTAGGHNAPPRGEPRFTDDGEPVYGERDRVELDKVRELGLPFWLAGGTGSPAALRAAPGGRCGGHPGRDAVRLLRGIRTGADGARRRRSQASRKIASACAPIHVRRPPATRSRSWRSPAARGRTTRASASAISAICARRTAMPNGKLGYRCAAEPVEAYVEKGGDVADTVGRRCLCNGLTANIGQAQRRASGDELPLVTSGDDLLAVRALAASTGGGGYSASDVIAHLLSETVAARAETAWSDVSSIATRAVEQTTECTEEDETTNGRSLCPL